MSPMDWEREARKDRVRRKGSEPAWIDAHDRGLETELSQAARMEIQQLRLAQLYASFSASLGMTGRGSTNRSSQG